jgi:hypothetical protein
MIIFLARSCGLHEGSHNSLINSWSAVGLIEKCNGGSFGTCNKHTITISGDARGKHAAYSDRLKTTVIRERAGWAGRGQGGSQKVVSDEKSPNEHP